MKKNKESRIGEQTPDYRDESVISGDILTKRKKLEEIHSSMAIWLLQEVSMEKRAKVKELQDRLFYRTLLAEESLLDEKIDLFSQALNILKK